MCVQPSHSNTHLPACLPKKHQPVSNCFSSCIVLRSADTRHTQAHFLPFFCCAREVLALKALALPPVCQPPGIAPRCMSIDSTHPSRVLLTPPSTWRGTPFHLAYTIRNTHVQHSPHKPDFAHPQQTHPTPFCLQSSSKAACRAATARPRPTTRLKTPGKLSPTPSMLYIPWQLPSQATTTWTQKQSAWWHSSKGTCTISLPASWWFGQ